MIPSVILTGKEGGTVIATRSKNLIIPSSAVMYWLMSPIKTPNVMTAIKNRKKINLVDYFWNLFSCSFGKRMILTSCPFVVMKLVLATQTGIPNF